MVHRRIEINPLRFGASLNPDPIKGLTPNTPAFHFHVVEIPIGNLSSQVISGLIATDERRPYSYADLFTLLCCKARVPAHPMTALLLAATMNIVVLPGAERRKRLAELNYKIAFEVGQRWS